MALLSSFINQKNFKLFSLKIRVVNKAIEIGLYLLGAFVFLALWFFGPLGEYLGAFVSTFSLLSFRRTDPDPTSAQAVKRLCFMCLLSS